MSEKHALERAVKIAGSQTNLAGRLTSITGRHIRQGHVWHWLKTKRRIPAEICIPIEQATEGRVRRGDLRPDLWPYDQTEAS